MTKKTREEQQDQAEASSPGVAAEAPAEASAEGFDPEKATLQDWVALVEQKEEEINQLKDRVLRSAAEMDNTRKRLERDRAESIAYANENLLRDLLPIVDNLERALEHAQKEADGQSLLDGVTITLKSFQDTLARFSCSSFEARGKPFDPNYHEAVMQEPSAEYPENIVLQELQKGYTLHNRLLRPALVVVSKAAAAGNAEADDVL
jgi:molecular chaperone GrpE